MDSRPSTTVKGNEKEPLLGQGLKNNLEVLPTDAFLTKRRKCSSWTYEFGENSKINHSVSTDFDLVCEKKHYNRSVSIHILYCNKKYYDNYCVCW